MNDNEFLVVLKEAFMKYLETGARSNEKLKILHSKISQDISISLNYEHYSVVSLNNDKSSKELTITGRYIDKVVDITVLKNNKIIAGIAVKFIMSNYSQNSNNYFENMLGETANIRSANIPYFQIFIIFDKLPYFDNKQNISKWEKITEHNINKYIKLSQDNIDAYFHTPNKTLLYIVNIPNDEKLRTKEQYKNYYFNQDFQLSKSQLQFNFNDSVVIYNDYVTFVNKVSYFILSI